MVDHLLAELNIEKEQPEAEGEAVFEGMNFVVTGPWSILQTGRSSRS